MNPRTSVPPVPYRPTDAQIREKAHELYMRSGWLAGRDLDNWLEAEAFLISHPPFAAHALPTPSRDAHAFFPLRAAARKIG